MDSLLSLTRSLAGCNDTTSAELHEDSGNQVSSTNESSSSGGFSGVGVLVLACLLVFFAFLLAILMFCVTRERRREIFLPRRKVSEKRIRRRYETIEGWLVSKKVQAHDTVCQQCVKEFSSEQAEENEEDVRTIKRVDTNVTDDECSSDESRECPICMEDLKVGDVVSWSANKTCDHVFHHECIKEWLLRHINCPFCRQVFMPVDEIRGEQKAQRLQEMLTEHKIRNSTTYYCVKEGLVSIPSVIRCTQKELQQLQHRICDCVVGRPELAELRGSRQDSSSVSGKDPSVVTLGPERAPRMETAGIDDIDPLNDSMEEYESSVIDEEMGQAIDTPSVEAEIIQETELQVDINESNVADKGLGLSRKGSSLNAEAELGRSRTDSCRDKENGNAGKDPGENMEIW